jgi:hypothetical protein
MKILIHFIKILYYKTIIQILHIGYKIKLNKQQKYVTE